MILSAADKDVVYRDMDQFDKVTNETHDGEANCYCLADLCKFFLRGFCAAGEELIAVTDELLGYLDELTDFVRHDEEIKGEGTGYEEGWKW